MDSTMVLDEQKKEFKKIYELKSIKKKKTEN